VAAEILDYGTSVTFSVPQRCGFQHEIRADIQGIFHFSAAFQSVVPAHGSNKNFVDREPIGMLDASAGPSVRPEWTRIVT